VEGGWRTAGEQLRVPGQRWRNFSKPCSPRKLAIEWGLQSAPNARILAREPLESAHLPDEGQAGHRSAPSATRVAAHRRNCPGRYRHPNEMCPSANSRPTAYPMSDTHPMTDLHPMTGAQSAPARPPVGAQSAPARPPVGADPTPARPLADVAAISADGGAPGT